MPLAKALACSLQGLLQHRISPVALALLSVSGSQVSRALERVGVSLTERLSPDLKGRLQLILRLRVRADVEIGIADGVPHGSFDERLAPKSPGDALRGPVQRVAEL